MRRKSLRKLFLLSCAVAMALGCGGGGWVPVAGKDAKAQSLTVPVVLNCDETHTITLRIFNNGAETIPGGFQARLDVYTDPSHITTYCTAIEVVHLTEIASGQAVDVDFALAVDILDIGMTLYFVATADSLDDVDEAIETNNTLETSRLVALERRADLVVESVALPDYMLHNSSYPVTVTVRNIDDKAATATFFVEVDDGASWSDSWQVNTDLEPGEAVDLTTTYTVGTPALGDRTFTATADTTGTVEERIEDNNSLVEVSPIVTMDLVLELVAFDPTYIVGVPYNATFRVTNNGSIPSPATTVSIYMLHSVTFDVLAVWSPSPVSVLAPGGSIDIPRSVVIYTPSAVDRYLIYEVDEDDLIEEDDETNNEDGITLLPL